MHYANIWYSIGMKILKERFLEAMAKANITNQIELSRRSGVATSTISLHLSGKRSVGQKAMEAYEKILKVNALWLQGKDETLKEILKDVVREEIAQYKAGESIRRLPCYYCPATIKYENFLTDGPQEFIEVTWTKNTDFVVTVIGNTMSELGISEGTCVGIKKLSAGEDISDGKIVLVCLEENGKEICTLKKYSKDTTAKTLLWKIIGVADTMYRKL